MKTRAALLLAAPAIVLFLLSFAAPLVLVGRLSFFATDYITSEFIGLANFANAFHDPYFLKSFVNVFWFVLLIAPASILSSYRIAGFLHGFGRKMQAAGRFVCYVPSLTSGLIMTLLWAWLLLRNGLINQFFAVLGIPAVPWLAIPWSARLSVAMVALSSGSGMFVILFSAAMHTIPAELHDAALIDGATERQYRRLIVRPILMPTILLALLLTIVGTMQAWETIYVLTGQGGPRGSTATPVYNIFQTAFQFGRSGYAAAKGIILMAVIAGIVAMKQRLEQGIEQARVGQVSPEPSHLWRKLYWN
jgi:ABC-type sugar transport system permease subunit